MMNAYMGLLWKFLGTILFLVAVMLIPVTCESNNRVNNLVSQNVENKLTEIGQVLSASISGDDVLTVITEESSVIEEFDRIERALLDIFKIYTNPDHTFPIQAITLLVPAQRAEKYSILDQRPRPPGFRLFEEFLGTISNEELERLFKRPEPGRDVIYKPNYQGEEQRYYSAFAPIYDDTQNVVAAVKIDMNNDVVAPIRTSFLGRFGWWLILFSIAAGAAAWYCSRMVTDTIDKYVDFVNRVSEGNYHLRVDLQRELHTKDELEKIGHTLNLMLEKIEGLIETEADRDRLQENITTLLKIVSAAADGDFTASAEVTADTLGALADSFNLMVAELSNLIRDVKGSSDQIAKSTREVLINTESMSRGADTQAKEIEHTYRAAKEMAEILKYANVRTAQAADSARKASQVALAGTEVVKKSIDGMHEIRERVQETARRVRKLGESSSEIGEITEVISDIANRTNLLALNATIEAARAGEAGRGFAVVADEVRMLAERSSQAAKDITNLIETIQVGTSETVLAMELGTGEVERGTHYVDEAGAALKEIIEMVQDSSQSIMEISGAFQQQTKASSDIAEAMKRTASIAQETASGARQSRQLAEQMESLSRILSAAVSKFRLNPASINRRGGRNHKLKINQSQ